jgi:hypothetical protein
MTILRLTGERPQRKSKMSLYRKRTRPPVGRNCQSQKGSVNHRITFYSHHEREPPLNPLDVAHSQTSLLILSLLIKSRTVAVVLNAHHVIFRFVDVPFHAARGLLDELRRGACISFNHCRATAAKGD